MYGGTPLISECLYPSAQPLDALTDSPLVSHSTADSTNSILCYVSGKEDKEEEERKDKEEELTSCERRRQENENSAWEAIWEKAARYTPPPPPPHTHAHTHTHTCACACA